MDNNATLLALVLSIGTLLLGLYNYRLKARKDYVENVESRVEDLEADLKRCREDCERLQRENVALMRRLFSGAGV